MKAFIAPQLLGALATCLALAACADDPIVEYPLSQHETWHNPVGAVAAADHSSLALSR